MNGSNFKKRLFPATHDASSAIVQFNDIAERGGSQRDQAFAKLNLDAHDAYVKECFPNLGQRRPAQGKLRSTLARLRKDFSEFRSSPTSWSPEDQDDDDYFQFCLGSVQKDFVQRLKPDFAPGQFKELEQHEPERAAARRKQAKARELAAAEAASVREDSESEDGGEGPGVERETTASGATTIDAEAEAAPPTKKKKNKGGRPAGLTYETGLARYGDKAGAKKLKTETNVAKRGTKSRPAPQAGLIAQCNGAEVARLGAENGQLQRKVEELASRLEEAKAGVVNAAALQAGLEHALESRESGLAAKLKYLTGQRDKYKRYFLQNKYKMTDAQVAGAMAEDEDEDTIEPVGVFLEKTLARLCSGDAAESAQSKKKADKKKKRKMS